MEFQQNNNTRSHRARYHQLSLSHVLTNCNNRNQIGKIFQATMIAWEEKCDSLEYLPVYCNILVELLWWMELTGSVNLHIEHLTGKVWSSSLMLLPAQAPPGNVTYNQPQPSLDCRASAETGLWYSCCWGGRPETSQYYDVRWRMRYEIIVSAGTGRASLPGYLSPTEEWGECSGWSLPYLHLQSPPTTI